MARLFLVHSEKAYAESKDTARLEPNRTSKFRFRWLTAVLLVLVTVPWLSPAPTAWAQERARIGRGGDPDGATSELRRLRAEIERLRAENERNRRRFEEESARNLKTIQELERRMAAFEAKSAQTAKQAAAQQQINEKKIEEIVRNQLQGQGPSILRTVLNDYWGLKRVVVTGGGAMFFGQDKALAQHLYGGFFQPVILVRLTDRMFANFLINGVVSGPGGASEVNLGYASFHYFVNDYLTLVAGKFLTPFGSYIEDQHMWWVNPFITRALPFSSNFMSLVPQNLIGVQARGALQWGGIGQDLDYTVYVANPIQYHNNLAGSRVASYTTVAGFTNGESYGARFRFYPLPLDSPLGRFEIGASTLDSKWLANLWVYNYDIDMNYRKGNLWVRGEWLESFRSMPQGQAADNRQAWFLQVGYMMGGTERFLPSSLGSIKSDLRKFLGKLELLGRWGGINHHFTQPGEVAYYLPGVPVTSLPFFELPVFSPALFLPHVQNLALGADYWFTPSVVYKIEWDIVMPGTGGTVIGGDPPGHMMGYRLSPLAHTGPVDYAISTEIAFGF